MVDWKAHLMVVLMAGHWADHWEHLKALTTAGQMVVTKVDSKANLKAHLQADHLAPWPVGPMVVWMADQRVAQKVG